MSKRKKRARSASAPARKKDRAAAIAAGIKLAELAGRPSKQDIIAVFGKAGWGLTWAARAERLGLKPERLCAKFRTDRAGVKAAWTALSGKK